jgi:hypothetical protein
VRRSGIHEHSGEIGQMILTEEMGGSLSDRGIEVERRKEGIY